MLQAIKIAVLAAFVHIAEGHVRALPTGANGYGCRDCNGKATPGPFRVNGPLGGNKAFGANGVATVKEGDEVEIAIGYNGGHRSNTLNYFNVRYACGAAAAGQNTFRKVGPTNKDTITCNAPCKQLTVQDIVTVDGAPATAANYPVDATQSNRDGYKVKFKIPAIQGAGDARKCTFALVEGRDWGAGWDFDIQPANAPPPPVQPPPPPANLAGTYDFTDQNCNKDAPGCTCLGGYIAVQHTPGNNEATASLNMPGYPQHVIKLTEKIKGAWTVNLLLSTCDNRADQILDITMSPNQDSTTAILNVGVTSEVPTVCGSIVTKSTTAKPFNTGTLQKCPGCQDLPNWVDNGNVGCAGYSTCDNEQWRTNGPDYYKKWTNAQGIDARQACCGCGGGQQAAAAPQPPVGGNPGAGNGNVGNPGAGNGNVGNPGAGNGNVGNPGTGNGNAGNPGLVSGSGLFGTGDRAVASASAMNLTFGTALAVFASVLM